MPGMSVARRKPSAVKPMSRNSTPRKSLTRLSRIICGGRPAPPPGRAGARRAPGPPRQRAALGITGLGVDDAAEHPAAVRHDPPGADDQGELQAVEHDVAVPAAID